MGQPVLFLLCDNRGSASPAATELWILKVTAGVDGIQLIGALRAYKSRKHTSNQLPPPKKRKESEKKARAHV